MRLTFFKAEPIFDSFSCFLFSLSGVDFLCSRCGDSVGDGEGVGDCKASAVGDGLATWLTSVAGAVRGDLM